MRATNTVDQASRQRIIRWVVAVVMMAFLVIGLLSFFSIRANAYQTLNHTHQLVMANVSREVLDEFDELVAGIGALAEDSTIQRFVQESGFSRSALFLRNTALGLFVTTVENNADLLRHIRYVTVAGQVLAEAVNTPRGIEVAPGEGQMLPDALFKDALQGTAGEVFLVSPHTFRTIVGADYSDEPLFSLTFPVYTAESSSGAIGAIQAEIMGSRLFEAIRILSDSSLLNEPGRRVMLINNQNFLLADSGMSAESDSGVRSDALVNFFETNPGDLSLAEFDNLVISTQTLDSSLAVSDMPWRLAVIDNTDLAFAGTNIQAITVLVLSVVAGLAVSTGITLLLRRMMGRFDEAATLAYQLLGGQAVPQDGDDALTQAIMEMAGRAQTMVEDVTAQRTRLKGNLDVVSRASRETIEQTDLHQLLNRVLDLICFETQFNHAQIFLRDEAGVGAALVYTRDIDVRDMLDNGQKPPFDVDAPVSQVIGNGQVWVSNDVTGQPDSPVAAETRARLVLPLLEQGAVTGALDIQGNEAGLFQDEEIQAFGLLADQISKAIYNHRLLQATTDSVHQINTLNQQLIRQAWENAEEKFSIEPAYYYDLVSVRPGEVPVPPDAGQNLPISIRGEVIGELAVSTPEGLTPDEESVLQALTDRVALAIERARLFQETQLSLNETGLLYEMTRHLNEIATVEDIIAAIVVSVMPDAISGQIMVVDGSDSDPQWLHVIADWSQIESERTNWAGSRLRIADYQFLSHLPTHEVTVIEDVSRATDIDDQLVGLLYELGAGSVVVIPLSMRGIWRGLVAIEFAQQRRFSEQDKRIYTALIDQASIAVENQSLIQATENERATLRSILETMPSGVLVLDAETFVPLQKNEQVERLLGKPVSTTEPFNAEAYNLYRTGAVLLYNDSDLPVTLAHETGALAFAEDIVAIHEDGTQVDLLMNAAPIYESDGQMSMIVAAFENISSLRGLESALQDNLRETIALYESSRSLSEAETIDDLLDVIVAQLMVVEPYDAAFISYDAEAGIRRVARTMSGSINLFDLPDAMFDDWMPQWARDVSVSDVLDAARRDALLDAGVAAVGTIPLRVRSRPQPIAWIVVAYNNVGDFESTDERYLTTLADSAATALDSRMLFQEMEAALQEASILYQAGRALTDASDHYGMLDAVVQNLLNADIRHAFVVLLDGDAWDSPGTVGEVVAGWNGDDESMNLEGIDLTPDQFPAWDLLASPELLVIDDVEEHEELDELTRMGLDSLSAQSVVIMPLRTQNQILGAIWMGGPTAHRYTERDRRIYRAFAEQASVSMDASRLYEQTQRRAAQLQTSAQVSQFASSILDLDMLLPRLVDLIQAAFNYDHVQIFLMDRHDRFAVLQASTGEAGKQLLANRHRLEKGSNSVIGAVTANAQPVIALDTGMVDAIHRPNPLLPNTRSEMALPLIIKGKVVGALDVQSNEANAFTEEDVAALTTLAAQISVAIDNARLFEQAEHRASDMSLLFAVTTAAASAESLTEALENVANDLRDSLHAASVAIYVPVEYVDEVTGETMHTMRAEAVAGYSETSNVMPEIAVGDHENIIGLSAQSLRAHIINQVEDEPLYQPVIAEAQSAVVVPLTATSRIIGLITMENLQPFAYNHETLTLLQTMGGTLTALIQNQQLLEQLQETNDQLLEIDRIKSEFLANMSHELRTPLNSIIGFSRVILKGIDGPLTEMQEQDLTTIYNSGQHLLNLINDILDQAKIAAGKMDIKPDFFDIKAVIDGVRSIGIGLVKDKPIGINLEIESGLPQVYGDEFRIRQVLLNLLSNATKFTQQGGITLSVYRAKHRTTGAKVIRVDVKDTGIGIAEKDLPLLFEAFRQVDSSLTRTAGGTGLGLPISKALVEMQGGEMFVESTVNVGSTFSITIPVDPPADEAQDAPAEDQDDFAATTEMPAVSTNGHRDEAQDDDTLPLENDDARRTATMPAVMPAKRQVLVIEDNPDRVDQFRRAIQREGFDVFAASIPLEAEAMASGLRPTVIIMDVNFAGGAGWDILAKLKSRDDTFDIPVIVVTLDEDQQRVMDSGAFAFLQHPIIPDELVDLVLDAERESTTDRILIIDDQPESTRLLKQLLDEHGHFRVFEAHNGSEGVSMVARRRPDLVILDLRMPEMDGFAVLEELRSNAETANIPVLVVTGDSLNSEEESQLGSVAVTYKTDISREDYQQFIRGVQTYLTGNGD